MKKRRHAIFRGLALLLALFVALSAAVAEMTPLLEKTDLAETLIVTADDAEPEADRAPEPLPKPHEQASDALEASAEADDPDAAKQEETLMPAPASVIITDEPAPVGTDNSQITLSTLGDVTLDAPCTLRLAVQVDSATETVSGTVTFWANDRQLGGPVSLQNNLAEFIWTPDAAGDHLLKAVYQLWFEQEGLLIGGEVSHAASVDAKQIDLGACQFSLTGADALYYTGAAQKPEVKGSSPITGAMQEGTDFITEYSENVDAGTGYVTISPGAHSQYVGSVTLSFTIHRAKTSVSLERLANAGSATLLAKVTRSDGGPVTSGAVRFTFAGGSASVQLTNGSNTAQCGLALFATWAAAAYEGDANHQPSKTASWKGGIGPYMMSLYAERYADGSVLLTATVNAGKPLLAAPEAVSFYDNGTLLATEPLNAGKATYTWPSAPNGSHLITAVHGSGIGSATAFVIVNHFPFDATFSAEKQTGNDVLLTTSFSGARGVPSGSVVFYDGEVQLGVSPIHNGSASLAAGGLTPGAHAFRMVYSGDNLYFPAVRTADVLIAHDTSITFSVNANSDGSADLIASLSGAQGSYPTGNITFSGFDALLGVNVPLDASGKAVYRWDDIPFGTYSLQAHYAGDAWFTPCESSFADVNNLPATVSFKAAYSAAGGLQFSLSIAPGDVSAPLPTGSVQFLEDGVVVDDVPLTNGKAQRAAAAPTKRMVASAIYSGDINYFPVESDPIVVGENTASLNASGKARPAISVVATAGSGDGPATLTATVSGTGQWPTGQVVFSRGTEYLGTAELFRGEAVFSWANVEVGSHTIYAEYRGDDMYLGGTAVTVLRKIAAANGQTITPEMLRQNPQLILLRDREGKVVSRYDTSLLLMRTGVLSLEKDKTRQQNFYSYGFNLGHLRELARIQNDGYFNITTPWFTAQMPFSLTSQMSDLTSYIVDRDLRSSELELRLEISKVTKKEDPLMKAYLEMEKPDGEFTLYQVELKLYTLENKRLDYYAKAFPVPVMMTLSDEIESVKTARYNLIDNAFIPIDTSFDEKGALILIVEQSGSYVIVKKT